jgi:hypothetical protein
MGCGLLQRGVAMFITILDILVRGMVRGVAMHLFILMIRWYTG